MGKGKYFDRRNYKALKNKVNHCGRMPGVDKWKCTHNISYLFSFLPVFSYFILIVLSPLFPCRLCHIALLTLFWSFHYISACIASFFPPSLCIFVSFLPLSLFLSKILFVRCQRSRKARCEPREVS